MGHVELWLTGNGRERLRLQELACNALALGRVLPLDISVDANRAKTINRISQPMREGPLPSPTGPFFRKKFLDGNTLECFFEGRHLRLRLLSLLRLLVVLVLVGVAMVATRHSGKYERERVLVFLFTYLVR